MKTLTESISNNEVLVAAHRGTWGANIPPNTIASFNIALREGADIIELDLFSSTDGEVFVFHTGMEPCELDRHIHIDSLNSKQIKEMHFCNSYFYETSHKVNTFDEVLEELKGRCIINVDRAIKILEPVMRKVRAHNMESQILIKSDPSLDSLRRVEAFAPDIDYMPVFKEEDNASETIKNMNIKYTAAELVFGSEQSPIIQDSYLEKMKKMGIGLFCNALVYSDLVPLCAFHDDDKSVLGNPDEGWGWLVNKGFNIIQTDWTLLLNDYLIKMGLKKF